MRQISDFSEISPLILKHFKRGVITNNFLTPADYRAEIAEERLFYEEQGSNLWLYVKREGFFSLFFYVLDMEEAFPEIPDKLVCEVPDSLYSAMEKKGYNKLLERESLKYRPKDMAGGEDVIKAQSGDYEQVYEILESCFDNLTGNLPSRSLVKKECEDGFIFTLKEGEKCKGILRYSQGKSSAKINHLAVREEFRKEGVATNLVKAFLKENLGKSCSVWTGSDKALKLYKSLGFVTDENRSAVYMKGLI